MLFHVNFIFLRGANISKPSGASPVVRRHPAVAFFSIPYQGGNASFIVIKISTASSYCALRQGI